MSVLHRTFTVKKNNRTSGLIETYKTVVDADKAYLLRNYVWNVNVDRKGNAYLMRVIGPQMASYLHKEIVGAGEHFFVEHLNGNTLDNRSENLKVHKKVPGSAIGYARKKINTGARRVA